MARLPPSRNPLHRGIRIPDLRTGVDSPLKTSFRQEGQKTCHFQRLSTPRYRRSAPNATLPTRLRHSTIASSSQSQEHSQGVPIVPADTEETCGSGYDAVPLTSASLMLLASRVKPLFESTGPLRTVRFNRLHLDLVRSIGVCSASPPTPCSQAGEFF